MKHSFLLAACGLSLFVSCRKGTEPINSFPNPLQSSDQVVEYHKTLYDNKEPAPYPAHFPYLFKKSYDPTGKTVTGIACSFEDERSPASLISYGFYHVFNVKQKGQMIYLINQASPKSNIPDTVARISLNTAGKAESCSVNSELAPDLTRTSSIVQHYFYKDNAVIAVESEFDNGFNPTTIDSVHYDSYGNILSFGTNTFQYDYTKKAKQQFYCEGYMGVNEPFYLLQYLGFFPEVTSPANVMIHLATTADENGALTNHHFDGQGRLVNYESPYGLTTITWK